MRVFKAKRISRRQSQHQKHLLTTHSKSLLHHPQSKKRLPSNYLRLQERIARSQLCYKSNNVNNKDDINTSLFYTKYSPDEHLRIKRALRKSRLITGMNQNIYQHHNSKSNYIIDNDYSSTFNTRSNCKNNIHNSSEKPSIHHTNVSHDDILKDHTDFGFRSTSGTVSQVVSTLGYCSSPPSSCPNSSISSSSSSSSSSSPSPLTTPVSTLNPKHNELTMLKHEAFQELACQTQRFDDLFIAKMIYWEGLSAEEKAQWLERSHDESNIDLNDPNLGKDEEMDELISALDCRATCKDYSALVAFERQAEIERRQLLVTGHQYQPSSQLACWDPESL